ncbi:MAG: DUF192 domain-containing protein [Acetobacteraceae bacterium]|nr:DUF192 domain-containing protein [Acetobacteraceae bacterium]
MNRRYLLFLLVLAPVIVSWVAYAQSSAQPELLKEKLTITTRDGKTHDFNVEMALTSDQQTVGLMHRLSMSENGGMLFDWGGPRESSMWMKNTITSLDIVFINQDGTIRAIAERTIPHSLAAISSRGPVRATLELAAGTTERLNIRVGDLTRQRIFGNTP